MLLILIFSAIGSAILVESGEQYLKIIEITKQEQETEMVPQQTKRIFKYNDSKTTIGMQVLTNDSLLQCAGLGRNIVFDQYDRNFIKILDLPNSYYSDDSLKLQRNIHSPEYFASNPILIGVLNTTFGLIMLSSNHNLYILNYSFSNVSDKFRNESSKIYNFSQLRQTQYEQTTAQLLWDDIRNIVFIIFPQQVVMGKVSKEGIKFHNSNISITNEQELIGVGKLFRGFLFLARGRLGIDIYSISDKEELILMKNLNSQLDVPKINVIDFDFGGFDHCYIFVLDQYQGMMIYFIEIAKFQITKWLDDLIPIQNGKLIRVHQRTILILQEHNSYNQITEYCIYTQDKKLFYMKTHYLDGKYFDIDVEEQFAIVRGYDSHKIIYHSIHKNFEQYHSNPVTLENWLDEEVETDDQEEYLTLPQLQQFILTKHDDKVRIQLIKDIMIAVTSRNLVFIRYLKVNPYVECTMSRMAKEGSLISVNATLNSTWCEEKSNYETYDHKEPLYFSLVMCQKKISYLVDVGKSLETEKNFYMYYVTITVVSLILLFGLLLILKHYFAKYNQRHVDLEKTVADLANKTYQQDNQVSGF